jgi:hypothetical protein
MYYPEKVNSCGHDLEYVSGGAPFVFPPGSWITVEHHVAMNTGGEHDGVLEAWVNGEGVLSEMAFTYRVPGATFGIDALYFSTFFGGSDSTWAPTADQIVDYDDFVVSTAPITH